MLRGVVGAVAGIAWVGLVLAALCWLWLGVWKAARRVGRLASLDREAGVIEELQLTYPEVMQIESEHASVDPAFAFKVNDQEVLLLLGQWLREPETFGAKSEGSCDTDADEAYANGLRPPLAFPTERFTVRRFPNSGVVAGIDLQGDYRAPERREPLNLVQANDYDSLRVRADFSSLENVVSQFCKGKA